MRFQEIGWQRAAFFIDCGLPEGAAAEFHAFRFGNGRTTLTGCFNS
jgi:hypothetical protein